MGMDLCYYGIREENMPEILEGNFFEEDFTNSKPKYILRVFSAKDFFYLYTAGKELEEEDYIFDVENTIESFNEFKDFYNELVKNNLGVYISIF